MVRGVYFMNGRFSINESAALIYAKQDLKDVYSAVSGIQNVSNLKMRSSVSCSRAFKYLDFKIKNSNYTVIIHEHAASNHSEAVTPAVYCGAYSWCIDTSVGKYKPKDIPVIVSNLNEAQSVWESKKGVAIIRGFVKKNLSKYRHLSKESQARNLVADVMASMKIKEDRLGMTHVVLENMILKILWRL